MAPGWLPGISLASLMFERSNVVTTHGRKPPSAAAFSSRMASSKRSLAARPSLAMETAPGVTGRPAGFSAREDAVQAVLLHHDLAPGTLETSVSAE